MRIGKRKVKKSLFWSASYCAEADVQRGEARASAGQEERGLGCSSRIVKIVKILYVGSSFVFENPFSGLYIEQCSRFAFVEIFNRLVKFLISIQ